MCHHEMMRVLDLVAELMTWLDNTCPGYPVALSVAGFACGLYLLWPDCSFQPKQLITWHTYAPHYKHIKTVLQQRWCAAKMHRFMYDALPA